MNYLSNELEGDILVIGFRLTAVVDRISVTTVSNEWLRELKASGRRKLIINFSSLEFVSSDLIGELVELRRYCLANGISLKLCCLSVELKQVLALTGLESQFKSYYSQRGAIESFAADNFVARHNFFARYTPERGIAQKSSQMTTTPNLELIAKPSDTTAHFTF